MPYFRPYLFALMQVLIKASVGLVHFYLLIFPERLTEVQVVFLTVRRRSITDFKNQFDKRASTTAKATMKTGELKVAFHPDLLRDIKLYIKEKTPCIATRGSIWLLNLGSNQGPTD